MPYQRNSECCTDLYHPILLQTARLFSGIFFYLFLACQEGEVHHVFMQQIYYLRLLKLFYPMKQTIRSSSGSRGKLPPSVSSKMAQHLQVYKASFRLRDVRPSHGASHNQRQRKAISDFYAHQQAVEERIKMRRQKILSNTTTNFFPRNSRGERSASNSSRDSSPLRRTLYPSQNQKPTSPSSFSRTSLNFRSTHMSSINKDENTDNYLNKYQIVKQLGKGSFSTVFLASIGRNSSQNKQLQTDGVKGEGSEMTESATREGEESEKSGELVAIKVYEKFKMNKDPHKFKNIRKEINIMNNLSHKGVLRLIESVESLTKISLIVEYGGEQSLLEYVKRQFPLKIGVIRDIANQLIQAICYLHAKNIVHRDIKLQNVLIREGKITLIDFGFSCLTHRQQKLTVTCGTPNYMAPQVISKKQYIGEQADIWSYGVVVFALSEGRHPFKAQTYGQLQRMVNRGKFQFKHTTDLKFISFIRSILKVKGTERPTAQQIAEMGWLKVDQSA